MRLSGVASFQKARPEGEVSRSGYRQRPVSIRASLETGWAYPHRPLQGAAETTAATIETPVTGHDAEYSGTST